MKVLYVGNGLTHYYNLVLSRLNKTPGLDLTVIAPAGLSAFIGDGVFQTKEGISFKLIELAETRRLKFYTTFRGLANVVLQERPDVVIVIENYLMAFLLDFKVVRAMRSIGAGLILKSIPFRYPTYQEALREIAESRSGFASLPPFANLVLRKLGLMKSFKRLRLSITRYALNLPDAHVNYVDAGDIWQSYGIEREKIFLTRNSPDTDQLFAAREQAGAEPPVLPANPRRLLHVGRLVAWKRVDMLVRAYSRVRERFPDAELLVIGSGPEQSTLVELAQSLRIESSVRFLGGVYDQKLLAQYYGSSSLYVLAGMGGLSINEAMCFALPIVCSVCDGTERLLVREGFNGRYFKDGDEDSLVETISWFLERPGQMSEMGRRSEEIIRNEVNIGTVIKGYLDALNYVARRKHT